MNPEIKKFIETNINLIEDNEWEEIYKRVNKYYPRSITREFTQLMLNAGIDPLDYLDYIPGGYLYGTDITSFKIPDHIKSIGQYAFYDCSGLTSITTPESVTSIGDGAFYKCKGLPNIDIPKGVTNIRRNTFSGCDSLTSIIIPDGVINVDKDVFAGCRNLTSIEIPSSITNLGGGGLCNCPNLTAINFKGTKKEWKALKKGFNWKRYSPISTIHCADGDIKI